MSLHLPPHRVVAVVATRGCRHQNCVVRAAAARLLGDLVGRLGADAVLRLPRDLRDRILVAGADALADGGLEVRGYGRALFGRLVGHPLFQGALLEAVPQSTLRHVAKALAAIKPQVA